MEYKKVSIIIYDDYTNCFPNISTKKLSLCFVLFNRKKDIIQEMLILNVNNKCDLCAKFSHCQCLHKWSNLIYHNQKLKQSIYIPRTKVRSRKKKERRVYSEANTKSKRTNNCKTHQKTINKNTEAMHGHHVCTNKCE